MNGCNSCNNRKAIVNNKDKINTTTDVALKIQDKVTLMSHMDTLNLSKILDKVEDNATMVLILEKEIDDQKIKSSGIKTIINDYRK